MLIKIIFFDGEIEMRGAFNFLSLIRIPDQLCSWMKIVRKIRIEIFFNRRESEMIAAEITRRKLRVIV